MSEKFKISIKKTTGTVLIVLGILGMILPVIPGVWFIPLGLELLGWKLVIDRKKPWREIIKIKNKDDQDDLPKPPIPQLQ